MRLINTFHKIEDCFPNNIFDIEAWRKYTKEFSFELSKKCEQDSKDYDFDKEITPVVSNVILNKEAAALTNASFVTVTKQLKRNISQLFESDIELDIILYLGLCNGAGWATTLDGRDAILLGIEKIIELNWQNKDDMQSLIFHEIGHIWHKTYGNLHPHTHSNGEKSLVQLYQEGIAMVCEQILCQDDNHYHQDRNGWLAWCVTNKSEIKYEFLKRIKANKSTQDFFGDWCNYNNHSDVGYYLGCEFIKYLKQQYSLVEIANLNINEIYKQFEIFTLRA